MYGKSPVEFPRRIVCLTAETTEIAFMLGAGDRVVGVPGTARRPEAARERARVGGFTTFRADRILALEPDLVLGFSDLQRDIVAELIGAGVAVLCTNQRRLDEVLAAILLIGGALGREAAARRAARMEGDRRRRGRRDPRAPGRGRPVARPLAGARAATHPRDHPGLPGALDAGRTRYNGASEKFGAGRRRRLGLGPS